MHASRRRTAARAARCCPPALAAQTLAQRVAALGEGTLRLSFAARPGVCGNGGHGITIIERRRATASGRATARPGRSGCRSGCAAARVADANTYVGGRWRPRERRDDRPRHSCRRARRRRSCSRSPKRAGRDAEELVTAATLADSAVVWPDAAPAGAAHRPAARDPAAGGLLAGPGGRRGRDARTRLARRATEAASSRSGSRRCSRCRSGRRTKACRR